MGLKVPTERDGEDWTRDEHIIAFNLYSQIPFGTIHEGNPKIIELAALLGRKIGSVSRKLANLSRFDPALQARGIRGLPHGAKGEQKIWAEFKAQPEALAYESEKLLALRLNRPIEDVADIDQSELPPPGEEREALVKLRVKQGFFRKRILSAYNFRCCVSGLELPSLLVASHIIPWAEDPANRLNPRNGLCLNALHDRAFDRHLMWVDDAFAIRFSSGLQKTTVESKDTLDWLISFEGKRLALPRGFSPDPAFLHCHARKCQKSSRIG
jgi:putative restriction endonuclease